LHFVVRPEVRATGRKQGPGGLVRASWIECPAFKDDRGRVRISQEGDAADPEGRQPLSDVGTQDGFPGGPISDEQDRSHQSGSSWNVMSI
jgi:hypothetical protein